MAAIRFIGVLILSFLLFEGVAHAPGGGGGYRSYSYPHGRYYSYPHSSYGWYGTRGGTYGTSGTYGYGGPPRTSSGRYSGGHGAPDTQAEYIHHPPSEVCLKFLDKTANLRKDFEHKRDGYWELKKDPKAIPSELAERQEEVRTLWRSIQAQNLQNCRWQN